MTLKIDVCPIDGCEQQVVEPDNRVLLNFPAVPYDSLAAPMTIMQLGSMHMASAGDRPPDGLGHKMHEHQPYCD